MSSINSIGGSGYSTMMSGMQPPDPSKMVDNLFSKLDPTGKGYITESDLQSAMDQLAGSGSSSGTSSTGSSASVDEIFKKLDTNGDSKITKEEMTSGMKNLASSLQGQLHQTGRGTPPSGSKPSSSSSTSSTTKTYQPADTNQDGTVSLQEEIAYALRTQNSASASAPSSSTSSTSGNSTSSTSTNSDARVMKQIVDLMRTYGNVNSSSSSSGLSVTA